MEYIIASFIIIWGSIYNGKLNHQSKKLYLIFIWLVMTLLMGVRYRVGIDTMNYMSTYQSIPTFKDFGIYDFHYFRYEPLFLIINIFCKSFFGDFWTVQLICAGISNGLIIIFLNRYCKNPFLGTLLYFYISYLYFSTEIMRESIAIGIFLLNYRNIEKNNYIKYYLFSFLSIGFHYSAIITWLIPLTIFLKFNLIFMLMIGGMFSITPFVSSFNEMLSIASISDRVELYIEGNNLNLNFRLGLLLQNMIPGAFACILLHWNKQQIQFKHMFLLQILFCAGAFAIPIIFQRFINYTQLFAIVLMSSALCNKKVSSILRKVLFVVVIVSQLHYYSEMFRRWYPYVSIFNPHTIQERELMWSHF